MNIITTCYYICYDFLIKKREMFEIFRLVQKIKQNYQNFFNLIQNFGAAKLFWKILFLESASVCVMIPYKRRLKYLTSFEYGVVEICFTKFWWAINILKQVLKILLESPHVMLP